MRAEVIVLDLDHGLSGFVGELDVSNLQHVVVMD
jgi:hypothetical protein